MEAQNIVSGIETEERARKEARLLSFAAIPVPVFNGRYWIRQITPQDLVHLEVIGSRFYCGGTITRLDAYNLLVQQMDLRGGRAIFKRIGLRRFLAKSDELEIGIELSAYMNRMMHDIVSDDTRTGTGACIEKQDTPISNRVHWCAGMACFFMHELHMTLGQFMGTPMPVLAQMQRFIAISRGSVAKAIVAHLSNSGKEGPAHGN